VRAFWKKQNDKSSSSCGELGIISTTGSNVKYPTQYISSGKNIEILSPIEMPLQRGKKYEFRIKVDNKNAVALIYGKTFLQLTKDEEGVFFIETEIPSNIRELSIGIADSVKGSYENIARYEVN
jgi:hypothetical protein